VIPASSGQPNRSERNLRRSAVFYRRISRRPWTAYIYIYAYKYVFLATEIDVPRMCGNAKEMRGRNRERSWEVEVNKRLSDIYRMIFIFFLLSLFYISTTTRHTLENRRFLEANSNEKFCGTIRETLCECAAPSSMESYIYNIACLCVSIYVACTYLYVVPCVCACVHVRVSVYYDTLVSSLSLSLSLFLSLSLSRSLALVLSRSLIFVHAHSLARVSSALQLLHARSRSFHALHVTRARAPFLSAHLSLPSGLASRNVFFIPRDVPTPISKSPMLDSRVSTELERPAFPREETFSAKSFRPRSRVLGVVVSGMVSTFSLRPLARVSRALSTLFPVSLSPSLTLHRSLALCSSHPLSHLLSLSLSLSLSLLLPFILAFSRFLSVSICGESSLEILCGVAMKKWKIIHLTFERVREKRRLETRNKPKRFRFIGREGCETEIRDSKRKKFARGALRVSSSRARNFARFPPCLPFLVPLSIYLSIYNIIYFYIYIYIIFFVFLCFKKRQCIVVEFTLGL